MPIDRRPLGRPTLPRNRVLSTLAYIIPINLLLISAGLLLPYEPGGISPHNAFPSIVSAFDTQCWNAGGRHSRQGLYDIYHLLPNACRHNVIPIKVNRTIQGSLALWGPIQMGAGACNFAE